MKQVPLAGRFFTWALRMLDPDDDDAFRRGLVEASRIPMVSQVTLRTVRRGSIEGDDAAPYAAGSATPATDSAPARLHPTAPLYTLNLRPPDTAPGRGPDQETVAPVAAA